MTRAPARQRRHPWAAWRARAPASGLKLLSWNVNGLGQDTKLRHVFRRLSKYAFVDILALQEIKVSAARGMPKGWLACPDGHVESIAWGENSHAGVLVRARIPDLHEGSALEPPSATRFPALQRRVAGVKLLHTATGTSTLIVSLYAPVTPAPNAADRRPEFIAELTAWLQEALPPDDLDAPDTPPPRLILAGDFNTIFTTSDSSNAARARAPDEVLAAWAALAAAFQLSDVWTRTQHTPGAGFTYQGPARGDGPRPQSRLDVVFASESLSASISLGPFGGGYKATDQDHRPLTAIFPTLLSTTPPPVAPRFPLPRLSPFWWQDETFASAAEAIVRGLLLHAPPALVNGVPCPRAAQWLLDWQARDGFPRRVLHQLRTLHRDLSLQRQAPLRQLDLLAVDPSALSHDDDEPFGETLDAEFSTFHAAQETLRPSYLLRVLQREGVNKQTSRHLSQLAASAAPPPSPLRRADGTLAHTPEAKARCAAEYFADLDRRRVRSVDLEHQAAQLRALLTPLEPTAPLQNLAADLSVDDIGWTLGLAMPDADGEYLLPPPPSTALARGKAPGPDGLPLEVYRAGGRDMAERLHAAYQVLAEPGTSRAKEWRFAEGVVILLHKKGDLADVGNWRPITLLNTAYKVLSKALAAKLGRALGATIPSLQTGFLPKRSIGTNIRTVQAHDALATAQDRPVFAVFIDFAKAFDTVSRDLIWTSMELFGVPRAFIGVIRRTLFAHTESRTTFDGALSPLFPTSCGVRQGCCLSPYLYVIAGGCMRRFLEKSFRPSLAPSRGAALATTGWTADAARTDWAVQYADDTALVVNNSSTLPDLIASLDAFTRISGLAVNRSKTLVWAAGAQTAASLAAARTTTGQLNLKLIASENEPLIYLGVDPRVLSETAAAAYWRPLVNRVRAAIGSLVRLPSSLEHGISMLGRSRLAASYALSRILYHAEYVWMPTSTTKEVQQLLDAYVERNAISRGGKGGLDGRLHVKKSVLRSAIDYGGVGLPEVAARIASLHARHLGALIADPKLPWCAAFRHALESNRACPARARGLVGLLFGPLPDWRDVPGHLRPLIESGRLLGARGLALHPETVNLLARKENLPELLAQPFAYHPLIRSPGPERQPIAFKRESMAHRSTPEVVNPGQWFTRRAPTCPSRDDGLLRFAAPLLYLFRNGGKFPETSWRAWVRLLDRRAFQLPAPSNATRERFKGALLRRAYFHALRTTAKGRPCYHRADIAKLAAALPAAWLQSILDYGGCMLDQTTTPPRVSPTLTLGRLLGWVEGCDLDPADVEFDARQFPPVFLHLQGSKPRDIHRRFLVRGPRRRLIRHLSQLRGASALHLHPFLASLARLSKRPHLPFAFDAAWRAIWRTNAPDRKDSICPHCHAPDSTLHALWECDYYEDIRASFSSWAGFELQPSHIIGLRAPPNWSQRAWELAASTYLRVALRLFHVRARLRKLHEEADADRQDPRPFRDVSTKSFLSRLGRNLTFAARVAAADLLTHQGVQRARRFFFASPGFTFDPTGDTRARLLEVPRPLPRGELVPQDSDSQDLRPRV